MFALYTKMPFDFPGGNDKWQVTTQVISLKAVEGRIIINPTNAKVAFGNSILEWLCYY